ncbi:tape measure protein [Nocardiopsis eucommiae]|uniref:tape measure protein n=1 Tax=Nocardiopsis eucommiae TaxID=2831970 RepID=UPI003D720579
MASVGYATLSIVPSIRGLAGELNRQLGASARPAQRAGEQIGTSVSAGASKGLGRLQRSIETVTSGAGRAFSGVATTVGRLAPALNNANRGTSQLGQGFRGVYTQASGLGGALNNIGLAANTAFTVGRDGAGLLAAGMQRTGVSASAANSIFYRMGGTLSSIGSTAGSALSTVGAAATSAATSLRTSFSNAAESAGETIRNTLGGAVARVGALIAGLGLGAFAAEVARVASGASTTQAQIEALYGAAGGGAAEVAALMDGMAERFRGLDMAAMREGAVSLAYMGLQGEEAVGVLERLEKATTVTGSGTVGLQRAMAGLTKGVNAGKFMMGELNQISDAGIPIYDSLADVLGVSIPEAQAMASAGAIGLSDVLDALSGDYGTWFPALLEGADNVGKTFSGAWSTVKNTLVNGFAEQLVPLIDRAAPLMLGLATSVESGFSALPGVLGRLRDALSGTGIVDGIKTMVQGVKDFGASAMPALAPFVDAVKYGLAVSLEIARQAIDRVGAAFSAMGAWMRENRGAVELLGAVIGSMVAGLTIYATVSGIARIATMTWAAAQWALNTALSANPIGLIVAAVAALVGGVIYAYRNFEGFRKVVDSVWKTIKTAALWIWDKGLKPAFDGIMAGVRWVGDAVMWLWNSAIKPAWNAIVGAFNASKNTAGGVLDGISNAFTSLGQAAMGLWTDYIKPAFDWIWGLLKNVATLIIVVVIAPLVIAFKTMGAIVTWLWSAAIKPAFNFIAAGALWLWQNALKPAWDGIIGGLKTVATWFAWLWASAIKPAIDLIAAGALWLWNQGIKPAWDMVVAGAKWVASGFTWLWNRIKAIFNFIAGHVRAWWTRTRAIFALVVFYVRSTLGAAFTWFRDKVIKPVWDWISGHINRIWNNGIKPAFDKVKEGVQAMRDAFDAGKKAIGKAWEGIRDSAKKPVNFLIDTVYNRGIMPLWNKVAGVVGATKLKEVKAFATGGSVYGPGTGTSDSIPALLSHGEHVWTAREVRSAGGHGAVEQIRAQALAGGTTYARGGAVGFPNAPRIPSGKRMLDALADFVSPSGLFGAGVDLITGNYKAAIDKVLKPARDITAEIGTKGFPGVPHQIVKTGGDKIKDKITSLVESYNSALSAAGGGADSWVGLGSASERLQRAASWARTQHGLPYQWGGAGNPSWDCSGFMAAIENVIRGLRPGRRYTTHSFAGTPPAGWQKGLKSPFTVGVQHGGRGGGHMAGTLMGVNVESGGRGVQVGSGARGTRSFPHQFGFKPVAGDRVAGSITADEPMLYDQGGMLKPGLQLVYNGTGKPETVRTAAQEARVERLLEAMERGGTGNVIHIQPPPATVSELVDGVSYALRRSRRGGVHAGVR